jgi:transcription antitermination factor NusG
MGLATAVLTTSAHLSGVLPKMGELRWFAAHTCANHEKSVSRQLELRSVDTFLPLYEKVSHWKDRRVKLQLPLFPGYIFVRVAIEEKLQVLEIPSIVRLVGFNGHPTPLPEEEMQRLRHSLDGRVGVQPHPYLQVGRRVRIKSGALKGLDGILLKKKNGYRFVVSLDLIQRSIAVELDAGEIEVLL